MQNEDLPGAPASSKLLKANVFSILSVKFKSKKPKTELLEALQRLVRSGAHVTFLLRAPSYTAHELDTVLAPAIKEQLHAIKAVCGEGANRASVHQNLHLVAATHDAGWFSALHTCHVLRSIIQAYYVVLWLLMTASVHSTGLMF